MATEDLSRLVTKSAKQRPATLKDLRTQEIAIDGQTRLLELSRFQALGSLWDEITKKLCRFQIREEGTRLNAATQNAVGNALTQLIDTFLGADESNFHKQSKKCLQFAETSIAASMVRQSAVWWMRTCARNVLR